MGRSILPPLPLEVEAKHPNMIALLRKSLEDAGNVPGRINILQHITRGPIFWKTTSIYILNKNHYNTQQDMISEIEIITEDHGSYLVDSNHHRILM